MAQNWSPFTTPSAKGHRHDPGQIFTLDGEIEVNAGQPVTTLMVANTGDRPIQVGSHFHFAEANAGLEFDRAAAHGLRLDIAAGTAVRFEPGQRRDVSLVPYGGGVWFTGSMARLWGRSDVISAKYDPTGFQ